MTDLQRIFLGEGHAWTFLLECVLRTAVMFVVVLLLSKLTGKKEVRQFSILELIVIIGLGSCLSDPMLYYDVAILPAVVAIMVVLLLYRGVNIRTNRPRGDQWQAQCLLRSRPRGASGVACPSGLHERGSAFIGIAPWACQLRTLRPYRGSRSATAYVPVVPARSVVARHEASAHCLNMKPVRTTVSSSEHFRACQGFAFEACALSLEACSIPPRSSAQAYFHQPPSGAQ